MIVKYLQTFDSCSNNSGVALVHNMHKDWLPFPIELEQEVCFHYAKNTIKREICKEHFVDPSQVLHGGESPGDHSREDSARVAQHFS